MKPFYAFEALYNNVLLDFTPVTDIVVFNMAMLQIQEQSRFRQTTELLVDERRAISLTKDLTDLGYDVEQTSSETLQVSWAIPNVLE